MWWIQDMQSKHWESPSKDALHNSKPAKFVKTFQNHRKQHIRNLYILGMYRRHLQSTMWILHPLQIPVLHYCPYSVVKQQCFVYSLHTSGRTGLTEVTFSLQHHYHTIYKSTNSQRASQSRRADKAQSQLIRIPHYWNSDQNFHSVLSFVRQQV